MSQSIVKKRIRIALIGVISAFTVGILFGDRGLMKLYGLHRQSVKNEATMGALHAEEISLKEQIAQLERGGDYLERFAREQLGLVAADEVVYEFRRPKKDQP